MDHRLFIPLLIATLVAFPARSRADDTRWESLRVYVLADGQSVAVAVPAEWQEAGKAQVIGAGSVLRFLDGSGRPVEIPAAALARAAAKRSVLRPEDLGKISLAAR
ncbi:MAG TPA: hypothetical protein VEM38_03645 [Burkholderiales bacterium]|nr:hypothetical protein [Burkholderiales bacterium]